MNRELGCIVVDADVHVTGIRRDIVNTIRGDFPKLLVNEIMHVDFVGTAFLAVIAAAIFEGANQFLLLCIDGNHRLTSRLGGDHRGIDVLELRVPGQAVTIKNSEGLSVHPRVGVVRWVYMVVVAIRVWPSRICTTRMSTPFSISRVA